MEWRSKFYFPKTYFLMWFIMIYFFFNIFLQNLGSKMKADLDVIKFLFKTEVNIMISTKKDAQNINFSSS